MTSYCTEISIDKKIPLTKLQKDAAKEKLDKLYKEESQIVEGVFKNLECPGGGLEFSVKKFPQDNSFKFSLEDGKKYKIPLWVARHINNDCNERAHKFITSADGQKVVDLQRSRQRYQFLSTDFM